MILIIVISSILSGAVVVACGQGDPDPSEVVATTGILASITERIAAEDIGVTQLIPDGSDPHEFALSAEDRLELEQASLVVANGAALEQGIPLDETDAPIWELTANSGALREGDPHVWMDPAKVADALPSLADALAGADAAHAADYRRRAAQYADELTALDRSIADGLESIPPENRRLVTSHDALGYFADRYGLVVLASPFGPLGAGGEPSAAALQEAIDAVRDSGVPAVFAQAEDDPSVMERVASETGVEVVNGLLVESPGSAETYEEMLRTDEELIVGALTPDSSTP